MCDVATKKDEGQPSASGRTDDHGGTNGERRFPNEGKRG